MGRAVRRCVRCSFGSFLFLAPEDTHFCAQAPRPARPCLSTLAAPRGCKCCCACTVRAWPWRRHLLRAELRALTLTSCLRLRSLGRHAAHRAARGHAQAAARDAGTPLSRRNPSAQGEANPHAHDAKRHDACCLPVRCHRFSRAFCTTCCPEASTRAPRSRSASASVACLTRLNRQATDSNGLDARAADAAAFMSGAGFIYNDAEPVRADAGDG